MIRARHGDRTPPTAPNGGGHHRQPFHGDQQRPPAGGESGDRDELILEHVGLAYSLAARYACRGLDREDLRQVAVVGLIRAVDRFDPDRGASFASFAVPTILGEIKHHFRDHGWTIKVPRPVRELQRRTIDAHRRLEQELGRTPSASEVAADLDEATSAVTEALHVATCFRTASLDDLDRAACHPSGTEADAIACARADAEAMLAQLPPREREIFVLRYHAEWTQREIADRVGLSQMHVSRLLRAGLSDMRAST